MSKLPTENKLRENAVFPVHVANIKWEGGIMNLILREA